MPGPPFIPMQDRQTGDHHSGAVIGADGSDLPRTRAPGSKIPRSAAWWSVMTSKSEPIPRSIAALGDDTMLGWRQAGQPDQIGP